MNDKIIEQITALLEKFIPEDILPMIKEKLGSDFDLNKAVELVEEHKDKIPDSVPLVSSLKAMDVSNLAGSAEEMAEDGAGGLLDKAKGMLGM